MPGIPTWLKSISPVTAMIGSMKTGGKVHKTGPYKLHKGETVIPAKKSKKKK
jgi:hypothetical protein